jgi:hypothetical protein
MKILAPGAATLAAALYIVPVHAQPATNQVNQGQATSDGSAMKPNPQPTAQKPHTPPRTRKQQAMRAGYACGNASIPNSNCQTPSESRPK